MRKGEPLLHFRQAFVFDMAQTEVTPRRLIPEEEVYRQVFDAEVRIFLVNPSLIFCYHLSSLLRLLHVSGLSLFLTCCSRGL